MSDIISRIYDDIDDYVRLCALYNEKVKYRDGSPDCYGEHSRKLKKMKKEKMNE